MDKKITMDPTLSQACLTTLGVADATGKWDQPHALFQMHHTPNALGLPVLVPRTIPAWKPLAQEYPPRALAILVLSMARTVLETRSHLVGPFKEVDPPHGLMLLFEGWGPPPDAEEMITDLIAQGKPVPRFATMPGAQESRIAILTSGDGKIGHASHHRGKSPTVDMKQGKASSLEGTVVQFLLWATRQMIDLHDPRRSIPAAAELTSGARRPPDPADSRAAHRQQAHTARASRKENP